MALGLAPVMAAFYDHGELGAGGDRGAGWWRGEADWTDDEPHLDVAGATPDATPDYMDRIREPSDDQVLDIMGELWEDGHTALVGALADFFSHLDVEDYGTAASMSFAVVRRYTAGYREWHVGMPLPPYWQHWVEVAVSRVVDDATFHVERAGLKSVVDLWTRWRATGQPVMLLRKIM